MKKYYGIRIEFLDNSARIHSSYEKGNKKVDYISLPKTVTEISKILTEYDEIVCMSQPKYLMVVDVFLSFRSLYPKTKKKFGRQTILKRFPVETPLKINDAVTLKDTQYSFALMRVKQNWKKEFYFRTDDTLGVFPKSKTFLKELPELGFEIVDVFREVEE